MSRGRARRVWIEEGKALYDLNFLCSEGIPVKLSDYQIRGFKGLAFEICRDSLPIADFKSIISLYARQAPRWALLGEDGPILLLPVEATRTADKQKYSLIPTPIPKDKRSPEDLIPKAIAYFKLLPSRCSRSLAAAVGVNYGSRELDLLISALEKGGYVRVTPIQGMGGYGNKHLTWTKKEFLADGDQAERLQVRNDGEAIGTTPTPAQGSCGAISLGSHPG